MKPSVVSLLKHPIFLTGVGVVVVIAAGSFAYYKVSQGPAQYSYVQAQTGTVVQQVQENGTVQAATEVDLGFQSSGQIARVNVNVGQQVGAGQALASLNNGALAAQVATAQANLQAAQAQLSSLQAGTRPEQLAIEQQAVQQANVSLSNTYSGAAIALENGYISGNDAVTRQLSAFFNNAQQSNPTLTFQTSNPQDVINAQSDRQKMNTELPVWQTEMSALSASTAPATLDTAIGDTQNYLADVQKFLTAVNTALNDQVGLGATTLAAYQANLTTAQTEVSGSLAAAVGLKQSIASEQAAITQAQDALNLAEAGATTQQIAAQQAAVAAAQAGVQAAEANLGNTVIYAPIAGTVTKSAATIGMTVAPGTPVISLISNGAFQMDVYLSDAEVAEVKTGDAASVTLDAYPGVTFPASITSVDSSQTTVNGAPAYKAVLQFTTADPRLVADLTGNASITTATHTNVVEVPNTAIIRNDPNRFVLLKNGNGTPTEVQVQTGITGADGMTEITSGLQAGDTVVNFGNSTNS